RRQGTERIFTIPIEAFDEQIRYLEESGYTFITAQEVHKFVLGEIVLPRLCVLLTIDDGCASIYEHALPVLQRHGAKATIFLTLDPASYVFQVACGGERRLSNEELRQSPGEMLQFESHALTHRPLRGLSDAELQHELVESKRQLEALLPREVRYLA